MASVTVGMGRPSGAPRKSKVVTEAASYALGWTFSHPMHSCTTICTVAKSKVVTGTPSYAFARPIPDPVHICAIVCDLCWLSSPLACVG
jgi:hypothetical protein